MQAFDLKLENGKVVQWTGNDGEDAARSRRRHKPSLKRLPT